jgi:hypothetical protein
MIKKSETCIYCGEKMESITAKKRYCSSKCKLYYNREKNKRGAPFKNMPPYGTGTSNLGDMLASGIIIAENHKTPPMGLKGIDLIIWKSENQK